MEKFIKSQRGYVQMKYIVRLYIRPDEQGYCICAKLHGKSSEEIIEIYQSKEYAQCALDMLMEHIASYPEDLLLMITPQMSLERMERQGEIDKIQEL